MIVAEMHDVLEDSNFTQDALKEQGFSNDAISAIDCLWKRSNERYDSFILPLSKNTLARKIKVEDIKNNLDLTRLDNITDKDLARAEKYHRALKI